MLFYDVSSIVSKSRNVSDGKLLPRCFWHLFDFLNRTRTSQVHKRMWQRALYEISFSDLWTILLLSRYAIPSAISAAMRTILSSEGVSKFCTFPGLGQQRIYRPQYIVYLRFLKKLWRSPFSKNSMRTRTGWDLVTIPSRATTCSDL